MLDGLRLSFGTLSLLPVGHPTSVDRRTWGRALLVAPCVGVVIGALAWAAAVGVTSLGGSSLLAAVAVVGVLAVLTRGLHLDGLADVADGLGSRKAPADARAVMRQSDVGPFGVAALTLALLAQVATLAPLLSGDAGSAAVAVIGACVVSRAALTWACRTGVAPADTSGLGSAVAGSVPTGAAAATVLASVGVVVASAALLGGAGDGWRSAVAATIALIVAELWRQHCSRRLGGVTGDVLGATEQVTWTTFVVALSLT